MSDDNVQTVWRWFAELEQGNPVPEMCDPEIEIRNWAELPISSWTWSRATTRAASPFSAWSGSSG